MALDATREQRRVDPARRARPHAKALRNRWESAASMPPPPTDPGRSVPNSPASAAWRCSSGKFA